MTEFITNFCMFDCEYNIVRHSAHVRTILIVNLPAEQEGMDQFMREKKINK